MAREFAGTSGNLLSHADDLATDITGTALTIVAWIRPDSVATDRMVIAKRNNAGTAIQYQLSIGSNHVKARVGNGGGTSELVEGATTVPTTSWSHIGFVKNGTGANALKAYLNGAEDGSATSNITVGSAAQVFAVGRVSDTNNFIFDGGIAEIAIWDVALNASEMAALADGASPLTIRPGNLKGYWPLDGTASPEADRSHNSNELTITGTVNVAVTHPSVQLVDFFGHNESFALPASDYTDSATVLLDLQVSSSETYESADSATVTVDIQASGTEVFGNPPTNDNFADAEVLSTTLPGSITGLTTRDATTEVGEPLFGGGGDHQSIWFTFTPSASGWYKFIIPRSSMVYNGTHTSSWGELNMILYKGGTTVDTLAEATFANRFSINDATDVGFTDPGWLEPHDLVVLGELVAGTTYYIKIYSRTFGDFNKATVDFDLEWDDVAPAANEDFANRETITGASGTESVYFGVPSHETPDEPESVYWYRGAMGDIATVWYEWTCPASGWYQFELEPDTVAPFSAWSGHIAIYTGSALNALTAVAKNEGGSKSENDKATGQTKVRVNLTNGVVYKIQIATRGASFISSGINGELRWATASAPTGDTGAAAIVGGFNTSLQDNLGNTDDDIPSDAVSRLSTAFGTEWWYEDGAVGRSKWFKQTITETGTLRIEAENFDTTYQAYMEHGLLVYKGATFGTIAAVTAQSGIDAVMFGWQGNNAFGGSTHAPNDDEFLDVPVTAGDVVWLCWVTSYDKDVLAESTQTAFPADAPQGELNIKFGTSGVPEVPPDNDVLADVPFTADFYFQRSRYGAFWIENDAGFRDGYTHLATADAGEPAHGGFPATRSVWYIFNRFSTELGTYKFWVDSAVDCTLAIYDLDLGNTIGTLIAEDDDSGPGNNPEITAIFTQAGLYCIAVDSKTEGFFRLNFQKVVAGTPPANDDFANAEVISSLPFSSSGTTVDANAEPEEIESQELGGGPKDTVWYKYVADHTGHLKIRATCDTNNVDAYVYVDSFQGTTLEELVRHPDPPPTGPGGGIFRGFFYYFDTPEENDAASIYLDIVSGQTYYIRVQTEEGGSEDFTIYVDDAGIYVDLEASGTEEFHGTMLDDAEVYLNLQHSGTELFDPALTTDAATVPLIITPGAAWETHGQETEDTGTVTIILTPLGGECYSRFHFTGEGEADLRWETISDLCRWSGDEQVRWTSVIEVQPGC